VGVGAVRDLGDVVAVGASDVGVSGVSSLDGVGVGEDVVGVIQGVKVVQSCRACHHGMGWCTSPLRGTAYRPAGASSDGAQGTRFARRARCWRGR
jgi:hypothetical protein